MSNFIKKTVSFHSGVNNNEKGSIFPFLKKISKSSKPKMFDTEIYKTKCKHSAERACRVGKAENMILKYDFPIKAQSLLDYILYLAKRNKHFSKDFTNQRLLYLFNLWVNKRVSRDVKNEPDATINSVTEYLNILNPIKCLAVGVADYIIN